MNIQRLNIKNFRNFEEESFSLNSGFNMIIGRNGSGKSTILYATRVACGAYLLGIPEANKRHIWDNEIRRKDQGAYLSMQTPTVVEAEGTIDKRPLNNPWRRIIPKGKTKATISTDDIGEISAIARQKYDLLTKEGIIVDNPVIAYFGMGRLPTKSKNQVHYLGREIFKFGYLDWQEMKYSNYGYPKWLRGYDIRLSDKREIKGTKEAFLNAIKTAIPFITSIKFDGVELSLKVKLDEFESPDLPLSIHSDGIVTHTAMVAEIAYRCIMLNAHKGKNAVLESRGIVMIDELDLQLHPTWQKHVVNDLKKAFPNIQFVATTHSPFIIQSLNSDELINLDALTDIDPTDLSVDEIAKHVMQVESEFSIKNEDKFEITKSFLEKLEDESLSPDVLNEKLDRVSDPALRAFLELSKTAKGK